MIYCFDLDGTICSQEEDYTKARPFKFRVQQVNDLYDNGETIYIDSARGSLTGKDWTKQTQTQLTKWGVKYHKLRTGIKMYADIYIDNCGINDKDFFEDRI